MLVLLGNQRVFLSDVLGRGAAGTVYAHPTRRNLALKIYSESKYCEPARIEWLCDHHSPHLWERGQATFAWPIQSVYDAQTGDFCGFTMPRIRNAVALQAIVNPNSRLPTITRRWLWKTAISFLTRLHTLHLLGHVAGDINLENFLVDRRGIASQADLDSTDFQIPCGTRFTTKMNRTEFQPPELIGAGQPALDRGQDQDAYSAAILVSRLLQEGRHPFDCRYLGTGTPPSRQERMRDGIWPDSWRHPQFTPKPGPVPFLALPMTLQELLRRMFLDGSRDRSARPTVTDFLNCLVQHQPLGSRFARVRRAAWLRELRRQTTPHPLRHAAETLRRHKRKVTLAGVAILYAGVANQSNEGPRLLTHQRRILDLDSSLRAASKFATHTESVSLPTPQLWQRARARRRSQ